MEARKVDYQAHETKKASEEENRWWHLGQVGVLIWALGLLGYFYYSRGFIELVRQLLKGQF